PDDLRGSSVTVPELPEAGDSFLIGWKVRNTGFKTALPHMNKLTIYDASRCAGCKDPTDIIYSSETLAESIDSITQSGKNEYDEKFWISGLPAGHYEAIGELDVRQEVDEINEDNHSAFMVFDVKPASGTDGNAGGNSGT